MIPDAGGAGGDQEPLGPARPRYIPGYEPHDQHPPVAKGNESPRWVCGAHLLGGLGLRRRGRLVVQHLCGDLNLRVSTCSGSEAGSYVVPRRAAVSRRARVLRLIDFCITQL